MLLKILSPEYFFEQWNRGIVCFLFTLKGSKLKNIVDGGRGYQFT
jgi:hypothetical protein